MQLLLYGHYTTAWKLKKLNELNPTVLPFNELIIVLSGSLHYTIDNVDLILSDGEMAYIPAGHIRARQASSTLTDYVSIDFLHDEPLPFFGKLPFTVNSCILQLITSADILWDTFYSPPLTLIEPIASCLLKTLQYTVSFKKKSTIVKKMEHYLIKNINKPFRIKDLADNVFLSVSHCSALFKREIGMSPQSYYNNLRLQTAKQLLSSNKLSVTEVAEHLCYYDYNHFSRVFKQQFGLTPSQFKKLTAFL